MPRTLRLRNASLDHETESSVKLKSVKEGELSLGFKSKLLAAKLRQEEERPAFRSKTRLGERWLESCLEDRAPAGMLDSREIQLLAEAPLAFHCAKM